MMVLRLVIALLVISLSTEALAERRVALIIGNSAYDYVVPLANPRNDAEDMASKLESLGFDAVVGSDLDLGEMRNTIREFIGKLDGADIALLFYAGHGVQVSGVNYMVPVDARLSTHNDLDFEAMPMDLVLTAMERTAKVNLVFLDACRDSPFSQKLASSMGTRSGSVGRGLARLGTGVGSLIAFATQPGNVALDGEGRNSPFTAALLKNLGTPGQDITRDLINVRRDVLETTGGKQVPWENSSLTGEVILQPLVGTADDRVNAKGGELELAYWETIKDTTDKRLFEAYLRQYPSGTFATLAALKIDQINKMPAESEDNPQAQQETAKATEVRPSLQLTPLDDPRELSRAMQTELVRIGCLVGDADGKWGLLSRSALQAFAQRKGLKLASLEPTNELLQEIMTTQEDFCLQPSLTTNAFDGAWELSRRAGGKSCNYTEQSTIIFIEGTDVSAQTPVAGAITAAGQLDIYLSFTDDKGASRQNHITATINGDKGSGKFRRVGGECTGTVSLRKRP